MYISCEKPTLPTKRDENWAKPGDLLTFFFFDALTNGKTITYGKVTKIENGTVFFETSFTMCVVSGMVGDEFSTVSSWSVPLDSVFIIKKSEMLWFWLKAPFGNMTDFPSKDFEEFFKDGTKCFKRKDRDRIAELERIYLKTLDDTSFHHAYLADFID